MRVFDVIRVKTLKKEPGQPVKILKERIHSFEVRTSAVGFVNICKDTDVPVGCSKVEYLIEEHDHADPDRVPPPL